MANLKDNFPPSNTGKYTCEQAGEFANLQVVQWLADCHPEFLASTRSLPPEPCKLHTEVFLSVRLYAHVMFYKYYVEQREVKRKSDFGDLLHLFTIPYCDLFITERDLCDILRRIKRNEDTLRSTVVGNMSFFKDWDF